jgi:hypothetical protein
MWQHRRWCVRRWSMGDVVKTIVSLLPIPSITILINLTLAMELLFCHKSLGFRLYVLVPVLAVHFA